MSRRFVLFLAVAICIVAPAQDKPTRVLFIGNSYTFFNNMPEMFATLARASHYPVEIRMLAHGGWSLKDHWENAEALQALHETHWDYVVLQEQSNLGVPLYLNGEPRVAADSVFRPYAEKFAAEIHHASAVPIISLTWARQASPQDQMALNYFSFAAAKLTGSVVAPIGLAWERVRREQPHVQLFSPDGSHPSREGSYLVACTLFATIFHRSPEGLPARVRGGLIDPSTGRIEDKTVTLLDLAPDIAHYLQSAAWSTWRELSKKGGYLDFPPFTPPSIPPLPTGIPISAENLAGTWTGTIDFFPETGPVPMVLQLRPDGTTWAGHLEMTFNPKEFPSESFDLPDLQVGERQLTFSDPACAAINKGKIEFRAVLARRGQLRGIAQSTLPGRDAPIVILGTFQLRR
jgi:hypothetical protein